MKKVLQILMIPALLFMTSCSNQPATAANRTEAIVITAPKAVEAVPAQTDETEITEILFEPLTEPEFSMQPESAEPEPIAPEENEEPAAVIPEAEMPVCPTVESTEPQQIADIAPPEIDTPAPTEEPAETAAPQQPETEQPYPEQVEETVVEPVGCSHNWQCIHHEEEGHWLAGLRCPCGWSVLTDTPAQAFAAWEAHISAFTTEEAFWSHGGYTCTDEYIMDTPAWTEWVCSLCGEKSDTQP